MKHRALDLGTGSTREQCTSPHPRGKFAEEMLWWVQETDGWGRTEGDEG